MSKTLSQIATALECDKTAIRQAILSGGGVLALKVTDLTILLAI
jgi:hypothetical protein